MKKKDIMALVFAVVILLVAGYVLYTQILAPKTSAKGGVKSGTSVEVIGSIPSSFSTETIGELDDPTTVQDFTPTLDLTTGMGTTTPFTK